MSAKIDEIDCHFVSWGIISLLISNGVNMMNDAKVMVKSMKDVTFEEALQELEGIVASLERGEISLDDAITAFERGTRLKSHCQSRLEEARMKVEKIKLPADGDPPETASDFDGGES